MSKFFKETQKRPFTYPTIHEHRRPNSYMMWVIVTLVITGIGTYLLLQNRTGNQPQNPPPSTVFGSPTTVNNTPVSKDYKAAFAIYTYGTFRIFTASMYHNRAEDVYIQADNPNIVQVKKTGIAWDDFFKTLPFKLTKECLTTGTNQTFCTNQEGTLNFYLNGVKTDDLLSKEIKEGDKALITFGDESESQIRSQIVKIPNP